VGGGRIATLQKVSFQMPYYEAGTMGSIIIDLQNEMLSCNQKVSDLLRKAYVIARKLKIADFERYIHNELNGYHNITG
jgi:hypothetical protein